MREIKNAGMHECKIVTPSASVTAKKKGKGNERAPVMSDKGDRVDGVAFVIKEDGSNHHTQAKDGTLKRRVNEKEGNWRDHLFSFCHL